MMSTRALFAVALLALLPAVAGAWGNAPKPPNTVTLPPGPAPIEVWPYSGTDYSGTPSDPVGLVFLNVDPRAIRQALMGLDGTRPPEVPFDCTWTDAMGYEQTAWADTEGWVGSEIQLACVHPGAPLGDPFRFHLRLFRQGDHTLGAAHFEFLIPGTAEHEVLGWDFARDFVAFEMGRAGLAGQAIPVGLFVPEDGAFRSIRYPVYAPLYQAAQASTPQGMGLKALLQELGLPVDAPPPVDQPIPIPATGAALVLNPDITYAPVRETVRSEVVVDYDVQAPKPFCSAGEYDFVRLEGRVRFVLTAHTDAHGRFRRLYRIAGGLTVTPIGFPPGSPADAEVKERHAAVLTDHYGQVYERVSQTLLSDPAQSLSWSLAAGEIDGYRIDVQCGP